MKKKMLKVLSILLIGCSLFTVPASAVTYIAPQEISINNADSVAAENYQWYQRQDNTWACSTSDLRQGFNNMWISTNGKWYYLDENGTMVTNVLILQYTVGISTPKLYYVGADGSMQTNTNITIDNKQYSINALGECSLIQQPTFVKHDEPKKEVEDPSIKENGYPTGIWSEE